MHQAGNGLPDVASAARTAQDLASTLVQSCRLEPENITILIDPAGPTELGDAIADATESADEILFVYYVGHGLVDRNGDLYLATAGTNRRPNRLGHTAFPYPTLRSYVSDCTALSKIVVLDCCYSGRAINSLGGADDDHLAVVDIAGAYVLTSSGREEISFAPEGRDHTAFSGALIKLLVEGDPKGPKELTLDYLYGHLVRSLVAANFPRPRRSATGDITMLKLAQNSAIPNPDRLGAAPDRASAIPPPPILFGRPQLTSKMRAKRLETLGVRDSEIDGFEIKNLQIRAASMRGDAHRYTGEARQDAFDIWVEPVAESPETYTLIASVADGIGSQLNSHIGAQAACRFLRQELLSQLPELLNIANEALLSSSIESIVSEVALRLRFEADTREIPALSLSTTLACGIISTQTDSSGRYRAILLSVGDSAISVLRNGEFEEYVRRYSGDSVFPTLPENIGHVNVAIITLIPGDMVVIYTDGLGEALHLTDVRRLVAEWGSRQPPDLSDFYWRMSFRAETFDDDRTLICVWIS
jgi:serine/threonine protein phosphatase PrpC